MDKTFDITSGEILICRDLQELSLQAAERFLLLARRAVEVQGRFAVALAGGSTPATLYAVLASEPFASEIPWARIHVFWGDERFVPPQHKDSNYRMAWEALLSRVQLPEQNVHRVPVDSGPPHRVARLYEGKIGQYFRLRRGELPKFDLVLLGLGRDGHTASLFPGRKALGETRALVAAPYVPSLRTYRITLTLEVINSAANVVFLVSGKEKAQILFDVLQGGYQPDRLPAQQVRPLEGSLLWLADREAGAFLTRRSGSR